MSIPPTSVPAFPNVPIAPGVPPVPRQIGQTQAAIVGLVADVAQIAQLFLAPAWGLYSSSGQPVLASSSSVQQIINSVTGSIDQIGSVLGFGGSGTFACSVGALDFRQDYAISTAPQELGSFLSYNKVQRPFDGRVTFVAGGTEAQRGAFLTTVGGIVASLSLLDLVTPEIVYPSVNPTHYDYRRTARNGVSLLVVDVWVEQVRVSGTAAFSNTATPSGANSTNLGTVQPLTPAQNSSAGSAVAAGGLNLMLLIPTQALASQTINTLVGNQPTTLNIYQKGNNPNSWALFMDVLLNNSLVIGGVICQNLNVIIRDTYFGYSGDFAWLDTQGTTDPVYTGIGSRYQLYWFAPSELPAGLA